MSNIDINKESENLLTTEQLDEKLTTLGEVSLSIFSNVSATLRVVVALLLLVGVASLSTVMFIVGELGMGGIHKVAPAAVLVLLTVVCVYLLILLNKK
jgi:hypothetical protein